MKKLCMVLPLALILCFMFGCQDKEAMAELEAMKAQADVEEQNKKLMNRWVEEMDKGNFAIYDEICADNYVCHLPGNPEPLNREAHKQAAQASYVGFPDYHHKIEDLIAKADKVTMRVTNTGTHKGDFMGIPATGKEMKFTANIIAQFVNGKAVEVWIEADFMGLMQQLGVELKPKEPEK